MISKMLGVLFLTAFAAICLIALDHEIRQNAFAASLGLELNRPQSTSAAHKTLLACDQMLNGQSYPYFRHGLLTAERDQCLRQAHVISKQRPTQGYAWYIAALTLSFAGREQEAERALMVSQAVTPNESWLAARRVLAYLDLLGFQRSSQIEGFWDDAEAGLWFAPSRQSLAVAYVQYPQFRAQFAPILKRAKPASRDAFMARVETLLQVL
jgi:hypothetical protein